MALDSDYSGVKFGFIIYKLMSFVITTTTTTTITTTTLAKFFNLSLGFLVCNMDVCDSWDS